jgi:hypothetical protein
MDRLTATRIKALFESGFSIPEIAARLNIDYSEVSSVIFGLGYDKIEL